MGDLSAILSMSHIYCFSRFDSATVRTTRPAVLMERWERRDKLRGGFDRTWRIRYREERSLAWMLVCDFLLDDSRFFTGVTKMAYRSCVPALGQASQRLGVSQKHTRLPILAGAHQVCDQSRTYSSQLVSFIGGWRRMTDDG